MTREQIKAAALELNPAERETLAEELLLSVSDTDRDRIDALWLDEARRRDTAYQSGAVTARPADEIIHRLRNGSRP